jgi:GTP cyclohydrolase I
MGKNPRVEDILVFLESIAPAATAEDWDNSGLQVGNPSLEVQKILTSLDPTFAAVKEAFRREAQMLMTHHPLIFPSLTSVNRQTYPGDVIFEACRTDTAIVAVHTNLDKARKGINEMLAFLFHLENIEVLETNPLHPQSGMGRIGDLPAPEPLFSFAQRIKPLLGAEMLGVSGGREQRVRRVAVVGGSGGSLVPLAWSMGADVLVTGEVRHHEALRARSMGLAVIDAGHFHTEKTGFAIFASRFKELLNREGWRVELETFAAETNPMQWV